MDQKKWLPFPGWNEQKEAKKAKTDGIRWVLGEGMRVTFPSRSQSASLTLENERVAARLHGNYTAHPSAVPAGVAVA
jgi:hypothetical protein